MDLYPGVDLAKLNPDPQTDPMDRREEQPSRRRGVGRLPGDEGDLGDTTHPPIHGQNNTTQDTLAQGTLLGDRRTGNVNDSDEDSDREGQGPTPDPSDKGKGADRKREKRRYTIDVGEFEDELVLRLDNGEEVTSELYATVQTNEEFTDSAVKDPEAWRDGLQRIVNSFRVMRDDYHILLEGHESVKQENEEMQAKVKAQTKRLREADRALLSEQEISARLRSLRDRWRADAEGLAKENEDLKEKLKNQPTLQDLPEEVDSDEERRGVGSRHLSAAPSGHSRTQRFTPATIRSHLASSTEEGANKRYPDVPVFHGTHDRDTWESWSLHLDEKFHQSASLFPSERDKIRYIRDHTKAAAFDVIKTKANMKSANPYQTADEVVKDLDNHFGTYDKIAEANAKLQDPKFGMGMTDKNETFEQFYTRFTSTIAPLDYSEAVKINDLTRFVTSRLQYRLTGMKYKSFRDLVEFLRGLDMDLRIVDGKVAAKKKEDAPATAKVKTQNRSSNNQRPSTSRGNTGTGGRGSGYTNNYSKEMYDRILKEGRCFKCLEPGHRAGDANAPCKDSERLTKEQVEVVLKSMGVEEPASHITADTPELESKN